MMTLNKWTSSAPDKEDKAGFVPRIAVWIVVLLLLVSCGTNTKLNIVSDNSITFGTEETFDLATWNLREFPYKGAQTLEHLARMIPQLKLEVIAMQEINSHADMLTLASMIPHYDTYIYDATSSYRLAYLYDTRSVTVHDAYTIYMGQTNPFPRPPYILHLSWRGEEIYVINNHLKAYGDNYIDETDPWDEERRRRLAIEMLDQYIVENLPDKKVIVVGDMNDEIQEDPSHNVFLAFLNKPEEYLFATMSMAENITYTNASYPSWPSLIDHILITNELFEAFDASDAYCKTILIENAMGTWQNYSTNVSDHRPEGIRLKFENP